MYRDVGSAAEVMMKGGAEGREDPNVSKKRHYRVSIAMQVKILQQGGGKGQGTPGRSSSGPTLPVHATLPKDRCRDRIGHDVPPLHHARRARTRDLLDRRALEAA